MIESISVRMSGLEGRSARFPTRALLIPAAIACLTFGGCALPAGGPTASVIMNTDRSNRYVDPTWLAVVNVRPETLLAQNARSSSLTRSLTARFGQDGRKPQLRISRGDTVNLSLWEAPPGTLFSSTIVAGQAVSNSSTVTIPSQTIGNDGTIGVPYAGRIPVVGETEAGVERKIVAALQSKAVQPQALITIQRSPMNAVTVTGEVAGGARIPLSAGGERILDVIAAAGGLRAPVMESIVELTRDQSSARMPFQGIVQDPRENLFVRPGDIVTVVREPQTFSVLGATGRNAEIPFEAPNISAAQALAKAGGLQDNRADITGIFIFRFEPFPVAQRLLPPNAPLLRIPSKAVPIVYRFNFAESHTMLTLSRFRMIRATSSMSPMHPAPNCRNS